MLTPAEIHAQACTEANARLLAAGFQSINGGHICDEVSRDHPVIDMLWALAVASDVRELCADAVGRVA